MIVVGVRRERPRSPCAGVDFWAGIGALKKIGVLPPGPACRAGFESPHDAAFKRPDVER